MPGDDISRAQVARLNRDFGPAGWRAWLSDENRVWARRMRTFAPGTYMAWRGEDMLDADTPAEMRALLRSRRAA